MKKISKEQPELFEFSSENENKIKDIINKYPVNKQASAVMPLLYLAQNQNDNWIPMVAIKKIAKILNMSYIKVYEVATFYSMFNLSPVGKFFIQVCTTTPCLIRGSGNIVNICKKKISTNQNELSKNNIASWTEVECLGACVNAPMMQINDDYFEDLDEKKTEEILDLILNNKQPIPGSYRNRKSAEPENNRKTLLNNKNA
tara:strand:- start:87 stop:689 length:603 start_codon:yes stop_codon:yes gene_type:complete